MPRYFFDVRNNGTNLTNGNGIEVDSLEVAVQEAAIALADMARDMSVGLLQPELLIEIRDETNTIVAEVRLNIDLKHRHSDT
jgi:hypothetical protein